MKKIQILAIALLAMSCNDDDTPAVINEEELITTVELTLINGADPANTVVLKSVDNDGDGPNQPVNTITGVLRSNASYAGTIRFLNELESPVEDITLEVQDESDEHEVFYLTNIPGVSFTKTDVDVNGNPLGLRFNVQTGAVGTGTVTVVLRHEPTKPNSNTLESAGGETDVEVTFSASVASGV